MLDFSEHFLPDGWLDREVEEPRPDDLNSIEELVALRKIVDDNLGNIVGRSLLGRLQETWRRSRLRSPHSGRLGVSRLSLRPGFRLQLAFFSGPIERSKKCAGNLFLNDPAGQESPKLLSP